MGKIHTMIPDGVLSTTPVISNNIYPKLIIKQDLVDFDYGPNNIVDTSEGMLAKVWKGEYNTSNQVVYSADGVASSVVVTVPNILDLSITFDQNARPSLAYWNGTNSYLYWYNTADQMFETLQLPLGSYNPRVILDDKRNFNLANSDILLCYIRNANLCIRYQRERFLTEHILTSVGGFARLSNVGMGNNNRIQFYIQQPRLT